MPTMRPPVHRTDPITSNLAALQHESKGNTHRALIVAAVTRSPGLTAEHYGEMIILPSTGKPMGRTEAARRLSDAKSLGHVRMRGRITYNGTSQSLWFPVEPEQVRMLQMVEVAAAPLYGAPGVRDHEYGEPIAVWIIDRAETRFVRCEPMGDGWLEMQPLDPTREPYYEHEDNVCVVGFLVAMVRSF
jgi:hypothetical protein